MNVRQSVSVCSLALAFVLGCSDSDADNERTHAGSEPLYLAMTRIWDDTSTTSYLHVLEAVTSKTEVDVSNAREVNGPAKLYAYGENYWFAVGSGEEPTITRYELNDAGRLTQGAQISLQPFGVQDLWDAIYFVSPTQAYYPDTDNSQLIRWNPSTMEVDKTIALPETVREGYLSYYGLTATQRGDKLLFSVGWFDWNEKDTILPETGLVEYDTEKDELTNFHVDDRCAGVTQPVELASGDTYFVSSAMAAANHRLGRLETQPCALRVLKGESSFDAEYVTHLADLTGGPLAGEPVFAGDNALLLRVFDEDKAEIKDGAVTWDLTGQTAWTWSRWDLEEDSLTPVDELPEATADTFWFQLDGSVYASDTKEDYSETTLVNLTAKGGPKRELSLPGFVQNIARIR
jgi:hypothetical protein